MYILFFLVLLIATLVLEIYSLPANIYFLLNTDENTLRLDFYWLSPLIHAKIAMADYTPQLTVYFMNIRVLQKKLRPKPGNRNTAFLAMPVLHDLSVTASYGFESPFYTGILSGALDALITAFRNAAVIVYPDFLPDRDYFIIKGSAKLDIGQTINNLIKAKRKPTKRLKRSDYYGSAQYN